MSHLDKPLEVHHEEAYAFACFKREVSNLARCYLELRASLASTPSHAPHNVEALQAQGSNLGSREGPARPAAASAPSITPPISREDLTATLDDLNGMWAAMIDLTMTLPGAAAYLATRKELPPIIAEVFEQAAQASATSATRESIIEECARACEREADRATGDAYCQAADHCAKVLRKMLATDDGGAKA